MRQQRKHLYKGQQERNREEENEMLRDRGGEDDEIRQWYRHLVDLHNKANQTACYPIFDRFDYFLRMFTEFLKVFHL